MQLSYLIPLTIICLLASLPTSADTLPPPLTAEEATVIVEARILAERSAQAARRRRILEVDSSSETVIRRGAEQTRLRRVEPRHLELPKRAPEKHRDSGEPPVFAESLENHQHVSISLASTVYDDTFTEVTWRDGEGRPFTVWTNVNFKYLRTIHTFELDSVHFSYFGLTQEIDTNAFVTHPKTGEKIYSHTLPEWMPSARDFPGEPAYLVILEEEGDEVPEALHEQIDALLTYYTAQEAQLKAAHQRSLALRKAKAEYLKKNPQPEKDIVINYWPIRSSADL